MRVKWQFIATAITLAGVLAGVFCKKFLPVYWTDWFVWMLLFYWLLEMAFSFVLERYATGRGEATLEGRRFMRVYMVGKGLKMLLTVVFIVVAMTQIDRSESGRVLTFIGGAMLFYLLHLAGETYVVTRKK